MSLHYYWLWVGFDEGYMCEVLATVLQSVCKNAIGNISVFQEVIRRRHMIVRCVMEFEENVRKKLPQSA